MSKSFDRPVQHHEYIKLKYLSGTCEQLEDKAKKRKLIKAATKCNKIRIYDDDIDLKKLQARSADSDDELYYGTKEEKPVIAAIIDERPRHLKRKDRGKWVAVDAPDLNKVKVEKEDSFDENARKAESSDTNHLDRQRKDGSPLTESRSSNSRKDSTKDLSPPRHRASRGEGGRVDDLSPPRSSRSRNEAPKNDLSPPRLSTTSRNRDDSKMRDLSPRRRTDSSRRGNSKDRLSSRARHTDEVVVIKKERESPTSYHSHVDSAERSKLKNRSHADTLDLSPPRRRTDHRRHTSTHRSASRGSPCDTGRNRSSYRDSERGRGEERNGRTSHRYKDNVDHSSSRQQKVSASFTKPSSKEKSSSPTPVRMEEIHKKQGLSSATSIREEELRKREKEREMFAKIDEGLLGKGAKTIHRDAKTGKIRDIEAEEKEAKAKQDSEDAKYAKYKDWNVGLKQREEQQQNLADAMHEMSKPLARYEDDADLDKMLREKEQSEDPMLEYFRKKRKKEKLKEAKDKGEEVEEKPRYRGSAPAPLNRFGIAPGYRWDGVDRSNGFEKSYFARIAEKTAIQEEAYRWSTEDM